MSMIRIDPSELDSAASTLRGAAVELSDLGAQLGACVNCPLPPDIEALIHPYMSVMDAILDQVAVWIYSEANDLSNRAAIASTDIVSASSVGSPASATIAALGGAGVIGGSTFTLGGGTSGFTIVDPTSGQTVDPTMIFAGAALVGGHVEPPITLIDPTTGQTVDSSAFISGAGIIGGGSRSDDSPSMILAKAAQSHREKAQAIIDRVYANPNSSSSDLSAAFNAQVSMGDAITRSLAPSQATMEAKVGHILTRGEYYDLVPEARPPAGSPIP